MTEHDAGPDDGYARPPGVDGAFAPQPGPPAYTRAPETVSPQDHAVFSRPDGAGPFNPAPGERIAPKPTDR